MGFAMGAAWPTARFCCPRCKEVVRDAKFLHLGPPSLHVVPTFSPVRTANNCTILRCSNSFPAGSRQEVFTSHLGRQHGDPVRQDLWIGFRIRTLAHTGEHTPKAKQSDRCLGSKLSQGAFLTSFMVHCPLCLVRRGTSWYQLWSVLSKGRALCHGHFHSETTALQGSQNGSLVWLLLQGLLLGTSSSAGLNNP